MCSLRPRTRAATSSTRAGPGSSPSPSLERPPSHEELHDTAVLEGHAEEEEDKFSEEAEWEDDEATPRGGWADGARSPSRHSCGPKREAKGPCEKDPCKPSEVVPPRGEEISQTRRAPTQCARFCSRNTPLRRERLRSDIGERHRRTGARLAINDLELGARVGPQRCLELRGRDRPFVGVGALDEDCRR